MVYPVKGLGTGTLSPEVVQKVFNHCSFETVAVLITWSIKLSNAGIKNYKEKICKGFSFKTSYMQTRAQ